MEVDHVKEGMKLLEEGMRHLAAGPVSFYIGELIGARDLLFTRFSPFKVGDRVTLKHKKDWTGAWRNMPHLVPGELATVQDIRCSSDSVLWYECVFDNEGWIDEQGVRRPVTQRHHFSLCEADLIKVEATICDVAMFVWPKGETDAT